MDRARRLDLGSLLTRAEAAAPVGVVDAMAAGLLGLLGAHDVSVLIADFSGRSLNRLSHTVASESPGSRGACATDEPMRSSSFRTSRSACPRMRAGVSRSFRWSPATV